MGEYNLLQPQNILSVSQLTGYLRRVIESDEILQGLWVEGEVSNLGKPSSGHLYFTLKDSQSSIRCVMWRSWAARLTFDLREGQAIEAHGSMSVYEAGGQVQLYVDAIRPAGEGQLFQEFLRLKAKLEAEGLFDVDLKRPIPAMPKIIGVVTSPTGAALQDILNTLRRRFPIVEIVISPTPVQGVDAPAGIITALERLNRDVHPDVIIIARGGGSIEDLWAFNDEGVARAIANSSVPVVSGVGHETDFTLTDFAADLRAPTPTAAAEIVTPDRIELLGVVAELGNRHATTFNALLAGLRWDYSQEKNTLDRLSPLHTVHSYRQRLDEIFMRLERSVQVGVNKKEMQLAALQHSLRGLSPLAVLKRGFAIVTREDDGKVLKSASQVKPGEEVKIQLSQGKLNAQITKTTTEE